MKRQHPENPDLFWCTKCHIYKPRGEFCKSARRIGIGSHCKQCNNADGLIYRQKNRNRPNKSGVRWECSRCKIEFIPTEKQLKQSIRRNSEYNYCSRTCYNMRRQHPTNDNLFFCFGCKTYKPRDGFYKHNSSKHGLQILCKRCHNIQEEKLRKKYPENYRESRKRYRKKYYTLYGEDIRRRARQRYRDMDDDTRTRYLEAASKANSNRRAEMVKNGDPRLAAWRKGYKQRIVGEIRDTYVVDILKHTGIPVAPEAIELKRQQITMKRTLKQFKQWRKEKENESSNKDVYGKQCPDEKDHEGRLQP